MSRGPLKPSHQVIKTYYAILATFGDQQIAHEGALRSAFQQLLADSARAHAWTLIPELSARAPDPNPAREGGASYPNPARQGAASYPNPARQGGARTIRPDGTLRDANSLPRGYWEAKDTADDLDAEIVKKAARGYSLANTIFEDTRTAVLFQGKREILRVDLHHPQQLCDLLNQFYAYTEPDIADFEQAIGGFKLRIAARPPRRDARWTIRRATDGPNVVTLISQRPVSHDNRGAVESLDERGPRNHNQELQPCR